MKLLNANSITLSDFIGNIPPYAILSHTWEDEEVLYADVVQNTGTEKKGYSKVIACCKKAKEYGYEWVWIDTVYETCFPISI